MENKKFEGLLCDFKEIAKEQKTTINLLLENLRSIENSLIAIIEEHNIEHLVDLFDYSNVSINHEGYLCYNNKLLPEKIEHFEEDKYMTREEIICLCDNLMGFVEHIINQVQTLTTKEKSYLEKIV